VKIAFWDLETTDLKALMGRILCCSFVTLEGDPYTFRQDFTPWDGDNLIDDGPLCVAIRDELEKYDLICAHNGRLFDVPMLNARLAKVGERPLRTHFFLDTRWYLNSASMRIGSAKLENAQKYFALGEAKTPISWDDWQRAAALERDAMDQVVKHCEQDVLVLRELYPIVLPYVSTLHR
jgi:uncharacterized protein YprB with RNaseH-like and TPR domain